MAFAEKGFIENWKDKRLWNKITLGQLKKDLRRLDIEVKREQAKLHQLGKHREKLMKHSKGKAKIEKRGLAKEVKTLQTEAKNHEAMLMNLYNQRTSMKQVEMYKVMERKAKTRGLQKAFMQHQERIIDIIRDKGVDITDDMMVWKDLAAETGMAFEAVLQSDEEEEDILAEMEEREMDDDFDDLDLDDDDLEDEEVIVSLKKKKTSKKE